MERCDLAGVIYSLLWYLMVRVCRESSITKRGLKKITVIKWSNRFFLLQVVDVFTLGSRLVEILHAGALAEH
jgi:hypothetical protein